MAVTIKGFEHFIPDASVSNEELITRLNVTNDWILKKTGMTERKVFKEGATSDMILKAAQSLLAKLKVDILQIDCIIVATMTPDFNCPSTASIVHKKLGAKNAYGFDIMAACSGFIYGLQIARSLINSKTHKNVLLCAADKMSSIINPLDRQTVTILGDGAGVAYLEESTESNDEIIDIICKMDSESAMHVSMLSGGSQNIFTENCFRNGDHYLRFAGRGIFHSGVSMFKSVINELLNKRNLTFDDISYIVPHQANKRMIEVLADELNLPIEKFIINIEKIGNTSAASIPIALSEAITSGKIKKGKPILLASVGAGFTYGASLINLKFLH